MTSPFDAKSESIAILAVSLVECTNEVQLLRDVRTCRDRDGVGYFFFAARFSLYAIATACLTGFPALTSARMLLLKAALLADFLSGILCLQYATHVSFHNKEALTFFVPLLVLELAPGYPVSRLYRRGAE